MDMSVTNLLDGIHFDRIIYDLIHFLLKAQHLNRDFNRDSLRASTLDGKAILPDGGSHRIRNKLAGGRQ